MKGGETGKKGPTWRIWSHLGVPVSQIPHAPPLLVPPPGAATTSHPIQWERLIACL